MQVVPKHHQGTVAAAVESIAIIGLLPPAAAHGQPESEQVAGHKWRLEDQGAEHPSKLTSVQSKQTNVMVELIVPT